MVASTMPAGACQVSVVRIEPTTVRLRTSVVIGCLAHFGIEATSGEGAGVRTTRRALSLSLWHRSAVTTIRRDRASGHSPGTTRCSIPDPRWAPEPCVTTLLGSKSGTSRAPATLSAATARPLTRWGHTKPKVPGRGVRQPNDDRPAAQGRPRGKVLPLLQTLVTATFATVNAPTTRRVTMIGKPVNETSSGPRDAQITIRPGSEGRGGLADRMRGLASRRAASCAAARHRQPAVVGPDGPEVRPQDRQEGEAARFVSLISTDGTVLDIDHRPSEVGDRTLEQIVGHPCWDSACWSWSPIVQQRLRDAVERAASGDIIRYDDTIRVRGNRLVTIGVSLVPRLSAGAVTALDCSVVDVVETSGGDLAMTEASRLSS